MAFEPYRIAVIGGSGVYQMEGVREPKWVKVTTPFGAPSDHILTGELEGRKVAFLPRHGRNHSVMPSEINHRANIFALKKLNVAWIISCSAVGSLQKKYRPCDFVMIDQFVDRTKKSHEHTFFGKGLIAHLSMAHPVCEDLRTILYRSAKKLKVRAHNGGTYVNMEGPAFSTKAESLLNHQAKLDVIGMTNLGEARCAREAEISYATMAMITDYDAWKEDEAHVSVDMVISNLRKNAESARRIISESIRSIPEKPGYQSHHSLDGSVITPRKAWPPSRIKELKPILKRILSN